MSNYIRPRVGGATIFFMVTLAERGSRVLVDHIGVLREAVAVTRAERPFQIDAAVVMPDHMHMVWTLPEGDAEYSVRWGAIKARFTRGVRRVGFDPTNPASGDGGVVGWNPTLRSPSKVRKGDAGLWQRRFWEHHIRDAADYRAHVEYCWMNPMKHGYVERPEEWPYSSYRRDREVWRMGVPEDEWSGEIVGR